MNFMLFMVLLFGLQFFYWIIGRRASKKMSGSRDYFLAGKGVRFFPLLMTFFATQVGGGLVIGGADEAYRYGWAVFLYPLGMGLGLMALGAGLGKRLSSFPVSTVAQVLEIVYRSPSLKKFASMLSIVSLFMILVAQVIASSKFLMSIGFENTPLFLLFWAIIIVYTVQGGLRAVIATDFVQAVVFSAVFLFCLVFAGLQGLEVSFSGVENVGVGAPKLCSWLLMPLIFMVIGQDMAQRCFAGDSSKTVSKAAFGAGLATMLIGAIPIFFGTVARQMSLVIPEGSSVFMTVIAKLTNPSVTAVVGCAVLAAIISTATSLISAISSNLSNEFIDQKNMKSARSVAAVMSITAVVFALFFNGVVDMMIQSYDLFVSCLCVPILAALFQKQGNRVAAIASVVGGAVGFCLFRFIPMEFPKEIASILLSAAGYVIGSLSRREQIGQAETR
jgi:SSS family solute:Na+ symporter